MVAGAGAGGGVSAAGEPSRQQQSNAIKAAALAFFSLMGSVQPAILILATKVGLESDGMVRSS